MNLGRVLTIIVACGLLCTAIGATAGFLFGYGMPQEFRIEETRHGEVSVTAYADHDHGHDGHSHAPHDERPADTRPAAIGAKVQTDKTPESMGASLGAGAGLLAGVGLGVVLAIVDQALAAFTGRTKARDERREH